MSTTGSYIGLVNSVSLADKTGYRTATQKDSGGKLNYIGWTYSNGMLNLSYSSLQTGQQSITFTVLIV